MQGVRRTTNTIYGDKEQIEEEMQKYDGEADVIEESSPFIEQKQKRKLDELKDIDQNDQVDDSETEEKENRLFQQRK
ncbi:MAG: hypothetical protein EZS28_037901 [Streblomastix strix]|uniref:Uncharacterized protein n=1 Tax=Streblomastix strix TaxID=222440 RepID=A0A5J4U9L1_9EUKA|nr:MAG: hypothetical protein EZS28_037901 [Streblomastix strix]